METITSEWKDYELIDCGNHMKLERFGEVITIRPEPQAIWKSELSLEKWRQKAHYQFHQASKNSGKWEKLKKVPQAWSLQYKSSKLNISFNLKTTAFKHVGVFPEQANNWEFLANAMENAPANSKVLNLFAYTGGASLAAKYNGADVTHVDSIKQVISWAKENMESSQMDNVRWTLEDALKFVQREAKREKKYFGIIMDPPSFGFGPKGEKWKLEEKIHDLIKAAAQILEKDGFFILNTYSLGFSSVVIKNVVQQYFPNAHIESGEVHVVSSFKKHLPLGFYARFKG